MRRLTLWLLAGRGVSGASGGKEGRRSRRAMDAIDMLEQQHFGEQILILRARLQLPHRFVADPEQLRTRHVVFVLLEPLQDELLILLLE